MGNFSNATGGSNRVNLALDSRRVTNHLTMEQHLVRLRRHMGFDAAQHFSVLLCDSPL